MNIYAECDRCGGKVNQDGMFPGIKVGYVYEDRCSIPNTHWDSEIEPGTHPLCDGCLADLHDWFAEKDFEGTGR